MTRTMRRALAIGLLVLPCACGRGEPETAAAKEDPPAGGAPAGGAVPAFSKVGLDDPVAGAGDFIMASITGGSSIQTGPRGDAIVWRGSDLAEAGSFRALAHMEEHSVSLDQLEGYGLILGGHDLDAPGIRYTYFVARGTGEYAIGRREGANTTMIVDWKASDTVRKVVTPGEVLTNWLEVQVRPDSTRFFVNELLVETLTTDRVQPYGVTGLRINRMLDLRVFGFELKPGQVPTGGDPPL